jgi:hypothetical protein
MHKPIKKFSLDGIVGDDSAIPRLRNQFEQMLITDMRDSGYVPVLGLGPYWSTWYDAPRDRYEFVLTVYGVFLGKKEACKIEGISVDGPTVPRIAPIKSQQPSTESE